MATKSTTYRVATLAVVYNEPTPGFNPVSGEPATLQVTKVGRFGDEIELTDNEANRIKQIGDGLVPPTDLIKPSGAPLGYDEMNDKQLKAATDERGIVVSSSSVDAEKPLRSDYVNALNAYDQAQGVVVA